ncbi:MAG: rhamnulokinase [Acidobacteria bacterium]|nr:rhamnulokinase [Acidobacteriota bacterium]
MPGNRFLAFDIGAESGRAIVGTLDGGKLSLEEIHRFANEPVEICGTLHWDVLSIYANVLKGMRAYSGRFGDSVDAIGIDTWGLDFGLLARDGSLLQNPVHYRDGRTTGMVEEVARRIPLGQLFQRTGVSLWQIASACQLLALRLKRSPILENAGTFLMMPDLLVYFLTGVKRVERSNAIHTQLYDTRNGIWLDEVFEVLDLPRSIMPELVDPGVIIGELLTSVAESTGLKNAMVAAPCSHDTGSAVTAVPGQGDDWAFLSCGTWSCLGSLTKEMVTAAAAMANNFCNELAYQSLFLVRNIMGLWLLQQARAAWQKEGRAFSYQELVELAKAAPDSDTLVAPDDPSFLAPADMVESIKAFCIKTGQTPPEGPGPITRCILASLALCYRHALDQLSEIMGRRYRVLHIVGGGSLNTLLCQFTSNATGMPVVAGPVEATVIGNILVQAVARGYLKSAEDIREVVPRSSTVIKYQPQDQTRWEDSYATYLRLVGH